MELLISVCAETPVAARTEGALAFLSDLVRCPQQPVEIVPYACDVACTAGHRVEYDQRLPVVRSDRPENSVYVLGGIPKAGVAASNAYRVLRA